MPFSEQSSSVVQLVMFHKVNMPLKLLLLSLCVVMIVIGFILVRVDTEDWHVRRVDLWYHTTAVHDSASSLIFTGCLQGLRRCAPSFAAAATNSDNDRPIIGCRARRTRPLYQFHHRHGITTTPSNNRVLALVAPVTSLDSSFQHEECAGFPNHYIPLLWDIFFVHATPSLKSLNREHEVRVYLAVDEGDHLYDNTTCVERFVEWMESRLLLVQHVRIVTPLIVLPRLHGNNVYYWNHAAIAAYMDGADYIYQFSDDNAISAHTPNALGAMIRQLERAGGHGIACPYDATASGLCFQVMMSRKHIETFGYIFPFTFVNFAADDWITAVYRHMNRVYVNASAASSSNTDANGKRYSPCGSKAVYSYQRELASQAADYYTQLHHLTNT